MKAYSPGVTPEELDPLDGAMHDAAALWMADQHIAVSEAPVDPPAEFLHACAQAWRELVWSHDGHFEILDFVGRPPESGFFVYRLRRHDGRLVYVGSTRKLADRLRTHERRMAGLWDVATWQEFPDAASMLAAESEAIQAESPALNLAGV